MKKSLILSVFLSSCLLGLSEASAYQINLNGNRFQADDRAPSRWVYHAVAQQQDIDGFRQRITERTAAWQEKKNVRYEPSEENTIENIDYFKQRLKRAYWDPSGRRQYLKPKAQIQNTRTSVTAKDAPNLREARRKLMIRRISEAYEKMQRLELK